MSPNEGWGVGCGVSANEYNCAYGAQINFGDPTPYFVFADLNYVYHFVSKNNSKQAEQTKRPSDPEPVFRVS